MKKENLFFIIVIIIILIPNNGYANDTDIILEEQQKSFGIGDFLKESEKYTTEFLKDIDISEIFNMALTGKVDNVNIFNKIIKMFGTQAKNTLKTLISILLIVLIHSILKSVTDGLENSEISKIVYYVQYILIVTIIMSNFSDILKDVKQAIDNLTGFSQNLIPLLISLMIYTGSITTTAIVEPILLFLIEFISNIMKTIVIPIISIITVLIIISKVTERVQISKLGNFFKSSITWFIGIVLTVFVGVLSLEGSLTSSIDGITAKTTKAVVSSLIPVVRKSIGRWCRCDFRVWNYTKKCYRNSGCYYNNRNMYNTNYKTFNF